MAEEPATTISSGGQKVLLKTISLIWEKKTSVESWFSWGWDFSQENTHCKRGTKDEWLQEGDLDERLVNMILIRE